MSTTKQSHPALLPWAHQDQSPEGRSHRTEHSMLLAWICRATHLVQVTLVNGFSGHSNSVGKEHSCGWTGSGRQVHLAYPSLIPDTLCALPGGMPVATLPQERSDVRLLGHAAPWQRCIENTLLYSCVDDRLCTSQTNLLQSPQRSVPELSSFMFLFGA